MRIISDAYQHLGAKLLAEVLDEQRLGALHWADLWYEQTDFPELAEAIDYPAVFFDFAADTKSIGELEQDVTLNTDIYVAVDTIQDTAINSPDRSTGGLHYLELCALVHELLHGYTHISCGTLDRIGFSRYSARTNVVVYRMSYRSQVADTTATEARRATKPGPGPLITSAPVFDL